MLLNSRTSIMTLILLFKVILFLIFSSAYSNDLFIPFLDHFVKSLLEGNIQSPWQATNSLPIDAFPYHPSMLYVYSIFQIPAVYFNAGLVVKKISFLLPTLLADIIIYQVIQKFFPERNRSITVIYFLSPIILYAIYMHGQLDLWPTALLLLSIYYLLDDKHFKSSIYLGLAMTFKLHVAAVIPLYFFYILKRKGKIESLKYISAAILIYFFISLPWYFDEGFREMVLANPKQDLIWSVIYKVGEHTLYLSVVAILILYLRFADYQKVNRDLLITWLAILFAVFVLFIPPAPAWYLWLLPFLVYFYLKHVKDNIKILFLYGFFVSSYLFFFVFVWKGEYNDLLFFEQIVSLKTLNSKLAGLSFSLLQVSLAINLFAIYKIGVRMNRIYTRPDSILIGIGGDSGAGKSTLLHALERLLSPSVTLLEGDGDHRWERGNQNYNNITHLNPRANYLERQADNLIRLKKGEVIYRPDYDHATGKFTAPLPVRPTDFIILSGLHTFYLPKMRKVTDIKIFMQTETNLRLHWKILRDTTKRGYSVKKIKEQIKQRLSDSNKYITPQKNFADLVIEQYLESKFEIGNAYVFPKISLKISISSEFHFESLILALEDGGWLSSWDYGEDLKTQFFTFHHFPKLEELDDLFRTHLPLLSEIISPKHSWENSHLGLIQIFVLAMINQKYREVDLEI